MRPRSSIWLMCAWVLAPNSASALQEPYSGSSGSEAGPGNACGLVETTYSDPDWVFATSDRILRSTLCTASGSCAPTSWYDRVHQPPCYPENRFWKFEPGATGGFAFPMSALGTGTFDGLYVKPKVKFQLYSGSDDSSPFGPERTGQAFISLSVWQPLACDGFESGTIIVPGGAGELTNYSIRLGRIKVKLGGSYDASCTPGFFKVYVPTKWGGKLSVSTTAGTVEDLSYPDGSPYANGTETGVDKQGWYTFKVSGAAGFTVSTEFVQEGTASTVPWHFWYFPFSSAAGGAKLYDSPGACTKFDTKFGLGTATQDWEVANHKDLPGNGSWWGHCWGASLASVILQQPTATHPDGFTQEELEGLAAEFFDKHGAKLLASFAPRGAVRSATPGDTDEVDKSVHLFHDNLRLMLRSKQRAFHMNLLQTSGTGTAQVWNQGCYEYSATMEEAPGATGHVEEEAPRQVKVTTRFVCNDDFHPSTGDPQSNAGNRREQQSEYVLIYGKGGAISPNGVLQGTKQNWLTMTLLNSASGVSTPRDVYVPRTMFDVMPAAGKFADDPTITGNNPNIRADRMILLGLQKNSGF